MFLNLPKHKYFIKNVKIDVFLQSYWQLFYAMFAHWYARVNFDFDVAFPICRTWPVLSFPVALLHALSPLTLSHLITIGWSRVVIFCYISIFSFWKKQLHAHRTFAASKIFCVTHTYCFTVDCHIKLKFGTFAMPIRRYPIIALFVTT